MTTEAAREAAKLLKKRNLQSERELDDLKREISEKFGLPNVLRNSDILAALDGKERKRFLPLLKTRRVKSLSGVCVIAVMLPPASCPGECIYCPTSKIAPKSYTGFEPAARRARANDFDAFKQVLVRLEQLREIGHEPQKCELIVMGGTFNSLPPKVQDDFVKRAYDAFNGKTSKTLELAIKANENAKTRVIGLTFETRPDFLDEEKVERLLTYGATRVEMGAQSLDDEILRRVKRGHDVQATIDATTVCKNAFLKVGYHIMPGLFSTPEKDVKMFRQLFENPDFRPDMLKIYPCLVIPGTPLFEMWKKGKFSPYEAEEAAEVISRLKKFVPRYCRIMRVDRDIPTDKIAAGVKKSNLRELALAKARELGIKCECIRCREVGLQTRFAESNFKNAELNRFDYNASGGKEVFLSFDNEDDLLVGFLRLRSCENGVGVRELRVFGEQTPVGLHFEEASQHKSFGKRLLQEAEEIARNDFDARELKVLSGVGVREYYCKLGYSLKGNFMVKRL
jgi:elongator complex protein 3